MGFTTSIKMQLTMPVAHWSMVIISTTPGSVRPAHQLRGMLNKPAVLPGLCFPITHAQITLARTCTNAQIEPLPPNTTGFRFQRIRTAGLTTAAGPLALHPITRTLMGLCVSGARSNQGLFPISRLPFLLDFGLVVFLTFRVSPTICLVF